MPAHDTFQLVDKLLDGELAKTLTTWRANGDTLSEIAFKLRTDHDINVASTTVMRWLRRVDEEAVA